MGDLSLKIITERVVEAVLNEAVFNREQLLKVVEPVLRVWVKKTNVPRANPKNKLTDYGKVAIADQKNKEEKNYWKSVCRSLLSDEEMEAHYIKINKHLKELGYE